MSGKDGDMFDWDRDFEDTVRGRKIMPHAGEPASGRPEPVEAAQAGPRPGWRRLPLLLLLLALVPVGAGAVNVLSETGISGRLGASTQAAVPGSAVSLAVLRPETAVPAQREIPPLPPMQIYGERQMTAFQRGIARFPDPELQEWSAYLAHELDAARPARFLAHHVDMLALTRHELARRGLVTTQ